MFIRFGPFVLDFSTRQLTRDARTIHISPKAFDLLGMLAQARPVVLSKVEIQQRLWPDTFVAEANLSNLVAEIRAAIGDSARAPKYIRTAHKYGYAFCGDATTGARSERRSAPALAGWLEWGPKRFPLTTGEHVIGRDPDVQVRIDASTVSRRHARLVVADGAFVLEDFGSKNGTYRGADRVTGPVPLADGDSVRIGSEQLVFRTGAHDSTETQAKEVQ